MSPTLANVERNGGVSAGPHSTSGRRSLVGSWVRTGRVHRNGVESFAKVGVMRSGAETVCEKPGGPAAQMHSMDRSHRAALPGRLRSSVFPLVQPGFVPAGGPGAQPLCTRLASTVAGGGATRWNLRRAHVFRSLWVEDPLRRVFGPGRPVRVSRSDRSSLARLSAQFPLASRRGSVLPHGHRVERRRVVRLGFFTAQESPACEHRDDKWSGRHGVRTRRLVRELANVLGMLRMAQGLARQREREASCGKDDGGESAAADGKATAEERAPGRGERARAARGRRGTIATRPTDGSARSDEEPEDRTQRQPEPTADAESATAERAASDERRKTEQPTTEAELPTCLKFLNVPYILSARSEAE